MKRTENPLAPKFLALAAGGLVLASGLVYLVWPKSATPAPTPTPAPQPQTPPHFLPPDICNLAPGPARDACIAAYYQAHGWGPPPSTTPAPTPPSTNPQTGPSPQPQTVPSNQPLPFQPLPVTYGGAGAAGTSPVPIYHAGGSYGGQGAPQYPGAPSPPSPPPQMLPGRIPLNLPPPPQHNTVRVGLEMANPPGEDGHVIGLSLGDMLIVDLSKDGFYELVQSPDGSKLTTAAQIGSGVFTAIATGRTSMLWRWVNETVSFTVQVGG